jgi:hypothetical protein
VFDEDAACGLICGFERKHRVAFAGGGRAAPENTLAGVRARERGGIRFGEFPAQRQQAAGMVRVVVTEEDFLHAGQVHAQFLRVPEHGVGPRAGVEQDAAAIGFDQGGEAPFTDPPVRQHGRKHKNAQGANAMFGARWRFAARLSGRE